MKIDLILAFVCSAVSAMSLAFLFVRGMLGTTDGLKRSGSSLRAILAPIALVVEHRRGRDVELSRTLDRLEKLVVQSGGRFMEGATAAEVFAARFVFPLVAFAVVLPLGAMLRLSGGVSLMAAVFFAVLLYAYPESGLKSAALERTRKFTRDLPGALDVMPGGPVRDELSRVVAEVTIGTSLAAALNNVAARVGTNEANAVFSTLAQSLEMGTSVAENLQGAAQLIRHAARVKAQTQAQKAVVNMSFPLLLLILPGIFIVLFAPLVIQFINR